MVAEIELLQVDRPQTPHRHLLRELERDEEVPPQAQQPRRHHEARVARGRSRRSPGVNFTNILRAAFTHKDPKSAKTLLT